MSAQSPPRTRRRDGAITRQLVIQAVIDSVLEVGYYQSSTNEIARRAGVTWGVLQHQFGTREGLLLEVLKERSFKTGTFTLASGAVSDYYIDGRMTAVNAKGAFLIGQALLPAPVGQRQLTLIRLCRVLAPGQIFAANFRLGGSWICLVERSPRLAVAHKRLCFSHHFFQGRVGQVKPLLRAAWYYGLLQRHFRQWHLFIYCSEFSRYVIGKICF